MKNFILWLLIAFTFFGSVIYFVFSSDKSFTITYIKFNINPEFIIGINDKDVVKIYNPLNDDAKVLNLNMFNGYKLENAVEIILDKLDANNYLDVSQIDITVITKSDKKISYYYNQISNVIKMKKSNIVLVNNKASHEELLAYSNEVSYDVEPSYNNETLKIISNELYQELNNHVNNLINQLNINELELIDMVDVLTQNDEVGYFENYKLNDYIIDNYDLKINEESSYDVKFTYDETGYIFDIELNLVLEHNGEFENDENTYNVIEQYHYLYKNNEVVGLKTNFYKFS